jgi:hypothetical protein
MGIVLKFGDVTGLKNFVLGILRSTDGFRSTLGSGS